MKSLYHSRPLILLGVLGFWGVSLVEMTPQVLEVHKQVDNTIDPVLEAVSLWQGSWDLFAPDIDHWNTRVECVITWEDGSETHWSTIDWANASAWERMRNFRRNEYFDDLIANRGALLWPAFGDHLVRTLTAGENKNVRWADLIYLGETLLPPEAHWRKAYITPQFRAPERFYSWYPHEISESEIMLFGN